MSYSARAPGSLMLMGEHAVLVGQPALVCAVNQYIQVTLTPRTDTAILIRSDRLGDYQTSLFDLKIEKPFQFILACLLAYQSQLCTGCEIVVKADFSHQIGFGSSAAVTVALLRCLHAWLQIRSTRNALVREGTRIIRQVQTVGSGADIAAAVYGGVLLYRAKPFAIKKYAIKPPLVALYSGYKTPTPMVIEFVKQRFAPYPKLYHQLMQTMGHLVKEASAYLDQQDWVKLGELMAMQQGLLAALGVSSTWLQQLVAGLADAPGMLGAKLSGSGLGDCIIGLGELAPTTLFANQPQWTQQGVQLMPVEVTLEGIQM